MCIRDSFEIVIRFEYQQIGAAQMELDGVRDVAQIGHQSYFNPMRAEAETDRIDGVVRNGEAIDFDIANRKRRAGLKTIQARREFTQMCIRDRIAAGFPANSSEGHALGRCPVHRVFIASTHDEFSSVPAMVAYFAALEEPKELIWIEAPDHFFSGALDEFENAIYRIGSET